MVEHRLQPAPATSAPTGAIELLGRAVHRVRNLMMSVRGYAELIAISDSGDPEHRRWATRIVEQVDRLEALQSRVDGVLRETPEPADHGLDLIIRAAVERSTRRLAPDAAAIAVHFEHADAVRVHADGEDVAEAVAALIDNAREATVAAGTSEPVRVRVVSRGTEWSILVTDRGAGIEPRDLGRIGEAFFTRKPGHLGLGLFLANSLLHRHGMQLDLASAPGGGSAATIQECRPPAGGLS